MASIVLLPGLTISGESSPFGANLGAFTKGFADGFVSGLAVKVGLGLVAATFGAPVATGIGIAALAYGLYNTDFGALRTSITNIGSGNGTPADFEAAGELASMLVGVGKGRGGGKNPAPTSPKVGNSGPKAGRKQTFEVLDGVKRAKATDVAGGKTIKAEIDVGGRTVGTREIPVREVLSPRQEISTAGAGLDRWIRAVKDVMSGNAKPIRVTPGTKGTPIKDVKIE